MSSIRYAESLRQRNIVLETCYFKILIAIVYGIALGGGIYAVAGQWEQLPVYWLLLALGLAVEALEIYFSVVVFKARRFLLDQARFSESET